MSNLSSDVSRVCVIFNPTAKGERARRAVKQLPSVSQGVVLKPSQSAGAARGLAAEAVREGFGTIAAMGGDGTVHEVLNGLADEPEGLNRARLAVLPVGTVNVFAREIGLPTRLGPAFEVLRRGAERVIDIPEMEFESSTGRQRRRFVQMAGCGLDARAVELLDFGLKKRIGQFAYVVAGMRALREAQPELRVRGEEQECQGKLVLMGNGRFYGGSVPLFAAADLQDGLLDVCVFPKVNWFVVLRYACAFLSPKFLRRGPERHFQSRTVTVESSRAVPVELDGEHVGRLPVQCRVHKSGLRVVVPA